ncbi:MAG TPA: histidine kinase N-terminal 7TM domain-containing protein, partial [Candidatus Saccharimonas sp.]|nr:histidine kinase N-terminal 7TM domain-containing protein [Candidatus Saccharimonas sp.]
MILDQVLLSLVLGINVLLGLAVWYRAPRKPVNVFFGLITVGIAIWGASSFYSQVTTDLHQSLALVRIAFEGAVMIGVCFAIFSLYFPKLAAGQDRRAKTISVVIAAAGVVVGWLLLQPSFIADVTRGSHSNSVVTGGAYVIFPLFFVLLVGSALGRLVLKLWGAKSGVERQQIGYVLLGFAISAVIGSLTNLILPLITGTNELAKYGPFATVAMAGSMAYAIAAHRLFNIRLLVARSIAFALLLTTLGVVYATTAFSVGDLFFSGSQTSTAREAYNVILALILAFTFQPLRRFFERITDRVFYRDRYDSQVVLNEFSQILVSELELDRILKRALSELCRMLHIQYGQIVVFHHDRVYRVQHHGPLPGRLMVAPQLRQLAHPLLVADELEPGELRSLMDDHGVRISLELNTREEHIGYLLLGDKLSGNIYSAQDIRLLEIIGKELAVAISNAKAYTEIQAFNITLQERVDRATNRLRVA